MADVERASRLYGVLVTFRRPDALRAGLSALAAQTRTLDRLVIVDNDPGPRTRSVVRELAPAAEYVAATENLGPAGGIALGMERILATADDADWVVTLDDDDPPTSSALLHDLVRFADDARARDRSVGAVGADGVRCDRRRGRMVWVDDAELLGAVDVDWVGGDFFPTYSVEALRVAGPMRAELFFGFEELDLGLRVRDAGYRILVPGRTCREFRAANDQLGLAVVPSRALGELTWRRYYSLRNLVRILADRGSVAGAVRVTLVVGVAKPLVNVLRAPRTAVRHLRLNVRACVDAWTGRLGRTVEPVR